MTYLLAPVIFLIASTEPIGQAASRIEGTRVEAAMPAIVTDLSMSGTRIACLLASGTAVILDLEDGHVVARVEGQKTPLSGIAISPDGEWIATGGFRDWVPFGAPGANFNGPLLPANEPRSGGSGVTSPEVKIRRLRYKVPIFRMPIFNASGLTRPEGGRVSLWRASDGRRVRERSDFPHPVAGLAFDGTSTRLIIADNKLNLFTLNDALNTISSYVDQDKCLLRFDYFPSPQIVFSRDCTRAVCLSAGADGRINLILCDLKAMWTIAPERGKEASPPWAVAASPDGRRFVTSGAGPGLTVWDMHTGLILKTIKPDNGGGDTLFVSFADSRSVITVASDGLIRVVDLDLGRAVLAGRGPGADVRAAALDGRRLTLVSGGFQQVGPKVDPLVIWRLPLLPPVGP